MTNDGVAEKVIKIGEKFKVFERREDSLSWTEAENIKLTPLENELRKGDTTFKVCGWCEHNNRSLCLGYCAITGKCSLMSDYANGNTVVYRDTKCMIKALGAKDIASSMRYHKRRIEDYKSTIKRHKKYLNILNKVKEDSNIKLPPLARNRDAEYFKVGERIMLFLDSTEVHNPKFFIGESKFVGGTVVSGYRTYDGCVSYVLDDYPESKEGWGCGNEIPQILLQKDYEYFINNMDKYVDWLEMNDVSYGMDSKYNIQGMYETMLKEAESRRELK